MESKKKKKHCMISGGQTEQKHDENRRVQKEATERGQNNIKKTTK